MIEISKMAQILRDAGEACGKVIEHIDAAKVFNAYLQKLDGHFIDDPEYTAWLANAPISEIVAYAREHIVNQGEYWGDIVERLCAEVERLEAQNLDLRDMFK